MRLRFLAVAVACASFTAAIPARAQLAPTATPAPAAPPAPPESTLRWRSMPAAVSGALLITVGAPLHVLGPVMIGAESAVVCDSGSCGRPTAGWWGVTLAGIGALAIGIPLVIWGARDVPNRTASLPAWVGAPGGPGWRWQF